MCIRCFINTLRYLTRLFFLYPLFFSNRFHLNKFFLSNLLLVFLFFFTNHSYPQQIQRTESIGAYIYNFPKHIIWENESNYNDFSILLLSENPEIIDEIQKIAKSAKIKEKPIKLTILKEPNAEAIEKSRLIFITDDKKQFFMNVFDNIEGKSILLVSENLLDKRFVMINLYETQENKMRFEINKANIINQKLTIDDEILFLGGTLIDAAELYRKSQQSLRGMQKRLDSLNLQIIVIQTKIQNQNKTIEDQNGYIEQQKIELSEQLKMVDNQKKLLEIQKNKLVTQKDSLNKQIHRLQTTEKKLKAQNDELEKGRDTLKHQEIEIKRRDAEIKEKTEKLDSLIVTISRQRVIMIVFGVIILLIATLVVLIFNAYRINRLKNAQLKVQKVEIETINEELRTSNEEINSKNEELLITLEKLKEAQDQLVQSEKMASLGVLTAGIAHELNNPINFVYAGVNSLKKDFQDLMPILDDIKKLEPGSIETPLVIKSLQTKKENLSFDENYASINQTIDAIKLGADRTAEIVKGLRNFSRLDKENLKPLNIHESLDDVLILLKNKYKNHIEIVKHYNPEMPLVECISGKINQVFMNIIHNAIDAIAEKGQIIIRTYSDNKLVFISIKDTGKGMNENIKSSIFDPFFTTKEVGKGVGLGLSISYGIIQEHNGGIEVKSEEGKGSEFIIKLPILQQKKS